MSRKKTFLEAMIASCLIYVFVFNVDKAIRCKGIDIEDIQGVTLEGRLTIGDYSANVYSLESIYRNLKGAQAVVDAKDSAYLLRAKNKEFLMDHSSDGMTNILEYDTATFSNRSLQRVAIREGENNGHGYNVTDNKGDLEDYDVVMVTCKDTEGFQVWITLWMYID